MGRAVLPIDPRWLGGIAVALAAFCTSGRAAADCAGSEPPSDAPCTLADQCPESGVSCNGARADFAECTEDAKSRGLTLRCEAEDASIYCLEGEQAQVFRGGDLRPAACTTFVVAAAMAWSRAQRRKKPGR